MGAGKQIPLRRGTVWLWLSFRKSRESVVTTMMRWMVAVLALVVLASADIPVNCYYDDIVGQWTFYETDRLGDKEPACDTLSPHTKFENKKLITLSYPNTAVDNFNNEGTWTMVYNQGFEVRIAGRSYFAFSKFETTNGC